MTFWVRMMTIYEVRPSKQFKSDLKLAKKQHLDIDKLKSVLFDLSQGRKLERKYCVHQIRGGPYDGCLDCHIEPDWVLIYRYNERDLILHAIRTGSHNRVFNN